MSLSGTVHSCASSMSDYKLALFNVFEDWNGEFVTAVHKLNSWNASRDCRTIVERVRPNCLALYTAYSVW